MLSLPAKAVSTIIEANDEMSPYCALRADIGKARGRDRNALSDPPTEPRGGGAKQ